MNEDILKSALEPLQKFIESKSENFDFRYVSEFESDIKVFLEKLFSELLNNPEIVQGFIEFVLALDMEKVLREFKNYSDNNIEEIKASDSRIEIFIKLLERADTIAPNISFVILSRANIFQQIKRMTEPLDLFEEIEKARGEHKARLVMRFFREVCEYQYDVFLRILWELTSVINGRKEIHSKDSFGNLVHNLKGRLEKLGSISLLETEAGWLRNASAHASYNYNYENNSIIAWDKNKPPKEFDIESIRAMAEGMYEISANLLDVYSGNIHNIFFSNDIIEFWKTKKEKLFNQDITVIKELQSIITNKFDFISKNYKFG